MRFFRFLLRRLIRTQHGSVSMELVLVLPLLFFGLVITAVAFDGFRSRNQSLVATHTVVDLLSRESTMFTAPQLEQLNNVYDYLAQSRYPTRMRISSMIWSGAEGRHRLQWSYGTRGLMPLTDEIVMLMSTGVVSNWNTIVQLAGQLPSDLTQDLTGITGDAGALLSQITTASGAGAGTALTGVQHVGTGVVTHAAGPLGGVLGLPEPDLLLRVPSAMPGEAVIVVESFGRWTPFANVGVGEVRLSPIAAARPRFTPFVHLDGAIPVFPEDYTEVAEPPVGTPPDPNTPPVDVVPPNITPVTVVQQNFAGGDTAGWSRSNTTNFAGMGTVLGLFGNETFANPVNRSITLPAGMGRVEIGFDLWVVDSWDGRNITHSDPVIGDSFTMFMDGRAISTDLFQHGTNAFHNRSRFNHVVHGGTIWTVSKQLIQNNINIAGTSGWVDEIWRVTIVGNRPPSSFTLGLSARLNQGLSDESWAMTNFSVTATPGPGIANTAPPPTGAIIATHPGTRFPIYSGCPDPFLGGAALHVGMSDLRIAVPAPIPNPGTAVQWRGQNGQVITMAVTGQTGGAVWGTDLYTDDSNIAGAAVHAGILANGETGVIRLTIEPGSNNYTASNRNGVNSQSWGSWHGSYRLQRGAQQPMAERFAFRRQARGSTPTSLCPNIPNGAHFDASALYVLNWDTEGVTGANSRLRILTEDENNGRTCDSALLVRDPDGLWWFNDDVSGANFNASLDMGAARSGNYHVFLGTWAGNTCDTNLVLERY